MITPVGAAVLIAYGVGVGIWAERNGVPERIVTRARAALDAETRRSARILTDEIHFRHAELSAIRPENT